MKKSLLMLTFDRKKELYMENHPTAHIITATREDLENAISSGDYNHPNLTWNKIETYLIDINNALISQMSFTKKDELVIQYDDKNDIHIVQLPLLVKNEYIVIQPNHPQIYMNEKSIVDPGEFWDIVHLNKQTTQDNTDQIPAKEHNVSKTGDRSLLNTQKMWSLSTQHLKSRTHTWLNNEGQDIVVYKKEGFGWFLPILLRLELNESFDKELLKEKYKHYPEDLLNILILADENQIDWLMLDRDGEICDILPMYK